MIDVEALHQALTGASYHYDDVVEALTVPGHEALAHNSTVLGERALADRDDALATLIRLFMLQLETPRVAAVRALGINARFLTQPVEGSDRVRATLGVRPYASPDDGASGWLVADLIPGMDCAPVQVRPDFVLAASPASTSLAQLAGSERVGSALDLGTGCGVQSLHLAKRADTVVATDLNPRALELAKLTFALNGITVDVRQGSLYEPVRDERFDLIVANPPFVMSPPGPGERLMYRESDARGDDLVREVIVGGARHLKSGGTLRVLANWANTSTEPWERRLEGWARQTGCVAYIAERERLGVDDYVRMWLSDAGLDRDPLYRGHYAGWVNYFAECGIEAVSFGWLTLRKPDTPTTGAAVTCESWPHLVAQPVGPAIDGLLRAMDDVERLSDDEFLAGRWSVAEGVDIETIADPGAEDPRHIVIRQRTGLCRAVELTTELAAVVGAADGELSLDALVRAVAGLLGRDEEGLRAELTPRLREFATYGLLRQPAGVGVQSLEHCTADRK